MAFFASLRDNVKSATKKVGLDSIANKAEDLAKKGKEVAMQSVDAVKHAAPEQLQSAINKVETTATDAVKNVETAALDPLGNVVTDTVKKVETNAIDPLQHAAENIVTTPTPEQPAAPQQ